MFFNTNQVNNELLCSNCECRLDIPKILPCGETICSLCETSIQVNDQIFECLVCEEKHKMPENGFIINKSLSKILALELSKVSRGEAFDSLTKLLDNLQKKSNLIKLGIDNGTDLIKEHCMNLRNDVQLKTEECIEEVILQVNDISTKIIDEINEYEQELIESNKKKSKSLEAFNSIVKELESFHTLNTEYLNKNVVDDKLVKKSNEEATNLIKN
jgi:hypothetical protein